MGNDHLYRELKDYSQKTYKFRQRCSLDEINRVRREAGESNETEGVCAAACMLWIGERLGHSRANIFRWGEAFSGNGQDKQNEATMLRAYQLHQKHYQGQAGDLTDLEKELGLKRVSKKNFLGAAAAQGSKLPAKLTSVINQLQNGQAVAFEMKVTTSNGERGGHMVAAYKSRDGSNHFFDPNGGIYKINPLKVSEFMEALEGTYQKRGWDSVEPFHRPHLPDQSWAQIYSRDA